MIGIIICIWLYFEGDISHFYINFITYVFLFIVLFFCFRRIGKKFWFIEFLCIIPVIQWLVGIVIAKQVGVPIPVSYNALYAYLFGGTFFYIIGLTFPFIGNSIKLSDKQVLSNLKNKSENNIYQIQTQFIVGIFALILSEVSPISVKFILQIIGSYFFVSTIKFILIDNKIKWPYLLVAFVYILNLTFFQGMLGTIVFWAISLFILFSVQMKINLFAIGFLGVTALFFIMILYSAKMEYRVQTWKIDTTASGKEGKREIKSSPNLMFDLILERLSNPALIFSISSTLNMAQRINQGLQVGLVMRRIPTREPFTNGEMTIKRPIQSLVPRIFWPSKPLLPDPQDYKRFTGIQLGKYNSVTIGPIGEAYADFGRLGFIPLFFYGLFIKIIYTYFRSRSEQDPYYMVWFLLIMTGAISHTETTIAGSFNGYLKTLMFLFLMFNTSFLLKNLNHKKHQ